MTQTRRRGGDLEAAILEAAWAEMADHGWAAFSIAGVARRCGTAKPVIYRRWDNRVDLARAMLGQAITAETNVVRTTGDLRQDLVGFLRAMAAFLAGPFGEAVRGAAVEPVPGSSSALLADVPAAIAAAVRAAEDRGDLVSTPPPLVQNLGPALMMHHLVHTGATPDDDLVLQLVDLAWLPAFSAYRS